MIQRSGTTDLLPATAAQRAREISPKGTEAGHRPAPREEVDVPQHVAMVRSAIFRILTKDNPAYEPVKS